MLSCACAVDHYICLSIVDSHVTIRDAIDIRVFGKPERLPYLYDVGDIVRLDKYVHTANDVAEPLTPSPAACIELMLVSCISL